jgi:hypothetical protein
LVTELGIVIEDKAVAELKNEPGIDVIPEGKVIAVKEVASRNVFVPRLTTELGITKEVMPLFSKALAPSISKALPLTNVIDTRFVVS